jgi:multidrug efflux system membrane fusion protein
MITVEIFFLLILPFFLASCSSGKSEEPKIRPAVPVKVAVAVQKAIPIQVRTIGTVEPLTSVTVKAQVGGMVTGVYFREGQEVRKGDLLFTIDSRAQEAEIRRLESNLSRDQAQIKQAEANLSRNLSLLKNAEVEARRYAELVREGIATQEKHDEAQTNVQALEAAVRADRAALENAQAAVRADRAALENARIQLGYFSVHSPLEGRTGSLLVHVGNVIKANDQPLVTINQIRPIYVSLSVPEQELPAIRAHMASGQLRVEAAIPGEEDRPEVGVISFIDNAVDRSTGTIRLKGTFANREGRLWPGQFVQVRLTLTVKQDALVVPSEALSSGQNGTYLFVVKPDLTAEFRPVTVGASFDRETVIEKGISAGEKVVTEGQIRLTPGAKVEIKEERPALLSGRDRGR